MRRPTRRLFTLRSDASRIALLSVAWLMAVAACVCVVAMIWRGVRGDAGEWRRQVGNRTFVWGLGYVEYVERLPGPAMRAAETYMGNQWVRVGGADFGIGHWGRFRHEVLYSPRPKDPHDWRTGDPPNLALYRRPVDHHRTTLGLNLAAGAALLGIPPALVLSRAIRRHLARLRPRRLTHCAACDYDLRASPGRCPECGAQPVTATGVA